IRVAGEAGVVALDHLDAVGGRDWREYGVTRHDRIEGRVAGIDVKPNAAARRVLHRVVLHGRVKRRGAECRRTRVNGEWADASGDTAGGVHGLTGRVYLVA